MSPGAKTTPWMQPALREPISERWRSLIPGIPNYDPYRDAAGCWFDTAEADRYVAFIEECCTHIEGDLAGTPFLLQPWQKSIVGNLFGWKRLDAYGREVRRYRECLLYIARGNGKTPLAAAICLAVLLLDDEPKAQIYGAAGDEEQASLLFRNAAGMVENEEELSSRLEVYDGLRRWRMVYPEYGSVYKVISATGKGKHGFIPHLALLDELHVIRRDLVEAMQTAFAKKIRKQPLLLYMTTADEERDSPCNDVYDYACKVQSGGICDPHFLPIVYELQPDDDWTDPKNWVKANPNLDVSVSRESLAGLVKKAENNPSVAVSVKRLHMNIKVTAIGKAIDMDRWRAGSDTDDPVAWRECALERLASRRCYAGLDLGSTSDLTAYVLLFPSLDGTRTVELLPWFWAPRERLTKLDANHRALYEAWADQGFLLLTGGNVTDYDVVRADINAESKPFEVVEMAVDRLFQGAQTCTQLASDGYTIVEFGQGYTSMAAPTKEFLERVARGEVDCGGNPVLTWMASNLCVSTDPAGCQKPCKPNRMSPAKIDGIVAGIMALGRAMLVDPAKGSSVYENRGLRKL